MISSLNFGPADLGKAYAIAAEVHAVQVGKDGRPYFEHVYEVSRRAGKQYDRLEWNAPWQRIQVQILAVLHDTFEDFEGPTVGYQILRTRVATEFGEAMVVGLDTLSHAKGVDYLAYIEEVAKAWDTTLVKLCDLSHNLEAWRLPLGDIDQKFFDKREIYHRAFVRLMRSLRDQSGA